MKKFIDEIVDNYLDLDSSDALRTCIITPNKRAHRFIKQSIISRSAGVNFLPALFSIDDFIFKHIPLVRIDEVDLSYLLFQVFQNLEKYKEIDFDDFLSYSSILLHDFNEIDMQMADGNSIFSYLNDAKAIQQWNPDGSPLSASQKEYLIFYKLLANVYTEFRTLLMNQGLCYQGMAYRYFAENRIQIIEELPWKNILFAGFNALTLSEETIIKALSKKEIVKTIWDVDSYYLEDNLMEAGMYMRKYLSWNKSIKKQSQKHFQESPKKIDIIGIPGVLGQVRYASQIMLEKTESESYEQNENKENPAPTSFENNTVIVPADESVLVPLLNSLPSRILKNTNITMGFSIQHTHAYRLAESLIRLHLHSSKISSINKNKSRFHKEDLITVLNNELIGLLNDYTQISSTDILQTFIGQELVFRIIDQLKLNKIKSIFESCNNKPALLVEKLQTVFTQLLALDTDVEKNIIKPEVKDALQQILLVFNRLSTLIEQYQKPNTLQGFYTLYKQLISGLSQSFLGNIHKGLQLMGLLETRLMDFENVIIVSTNEDILPASAFSSSFIPSDIRFEFNLPGIQERTAVYAYHFYRLIQRAKNVFLIYSTTKKKMSGGEKSRFIKQLEFELKNKNKKIQISHRLLNFEKLSISQNKEIKIEKDEEILNKMDYLAKKGLSPTSLISYIRCPLQFYFKYINKIYEPDSPEDIVDDRIIGNVIHQILEDFYRPYIRQNFPFEKLKILKKELPLLIANTFKMKFKGKIDEGPNYISLKDTEHYLNKFIDHEIQASQNHQQELIILGVEQNLERILKIEQNLITKEILIKGNADRIDEINGVIRILDYKTGAIDKSKVKIPKKKDEEINNLFTKSEHDKAMQLYVYHWLYRENSNAHAQAGIVSFRLIKAPYVMLKQEITEELDADFQTFISQIFDPKIPFTQTNDEKNCSYCIYQDICSRK